MPNFSKIAISLKRFDNLVTFVFILIFTCLVMMASRIKYLNKDNFVDLIYEVQQFCFNR